MKDRSHEKNKTYSSFFGHLRETVEAYRPIFPFFAANRLRLAVGVLCLLIVDALQLLIPQAIKRAVDLLAAGQATAGSLLAPAGAIAGIAVLIALFRYIWRYFIFGHSRLVEKGLRSRLYRHLQTLSPSFYRRMRTGDVMARATNDINAVRMAAGMGLVALVDGVVLGLAAVGFMLAISPALTLISLAPAPLVIVGTKILTRRMSTGFETVQRLFSDITEMAREAFSGIRVIKAYDRRGWQEERLRREGARYVDANMTLARSLAFFIPMMAVATNAGLAAVIWFGGRLAILGAITTGDFVAFISYLTLLAWPMMAMGWVLNLLQRGAAAMRRIGGVLAEVSDIADPPGAPSSSRLAGSIEFRNVSVRYPGGRDPALRNVELKIEDGETVAVVGRVGSGKTTLMSLLPRLIDPTEGAVHVGELDTRSVPLAVLRRHMGFVTQDVFVFSDTVRNNVLFGREPAGEDQVESVLHAAGILEEMTSLEKGLDTMLGERGLSLSGGQRQRLTIARALFENPPILLLDDALSMVDGHTEAGIVDHVLARGGRTTLLISHRPSTIRRADRIVVLEDGRVVEIGSHEELIDSAGIYRELYEDALLREMLEGDGGRDAR